MSLGAGRAKLAVRIGAAPVPALDRRTGPEHALAHRGDGAAQRRQHLVGARLRLLGAEGGRLRARLLRGSRRGEDRGGGGGEQEQAVHRKHSAAKWRRD
jgi:hypothetical protein